MKIFRIRHIALIIAVLLFALTATAAFAENGPTVAPEQTPAQPDVSTGGDGSGEGGEGSEGGEGGRETAAPVETIAPPITPGGGITPPAEPTATPAPATDGDTDGETAVPQVIRCNIDDEDVRLEIELPDKATASWQVSEHADFSSADDMFRSGVGTTCRVNTSVAGEFYYRAEIELADGSTMLSPVFKVVIAPDPSDDTDADGSEQEETSAFPVLPVAVLGGLTLVILALTVIVIVTAARRNRR